MPGGGGAASVSVRTSRLQDRTEALEASYGALPIVLVEDVLAVSGFFEETRQVLGRVTRDPELSDRETFELPWRQDILGRHPSRPEQFAESMEAKEDRAADVPTELEASDRLPQCRDGGLPRSGLHARGGGHVAPPPPPKSLHDEREGDEERGRKEHNEGDARDPGQVGHRKPRIGRVRIGGLVPFRPTTGIPLPPDREE